MADLALRHGLVANELRGPMESGVMGDASTEGDSATGGASTRAPREYTRANVRGRWLELRDRLRVGAPLPLETPSLTIAKTALATMMVELLCSGEDVPVMKRGPPKYADFAKSVPPQNPFTPASTHGGTSQRNISQYNNACSGSQICGDFAQPNSVHHYYHYPTIAPAAAAPPAATAPAAAPPAASAPAASAATATAPAAAPAATAPPSSEAQQLADMKDMFEQGLIPSHEIYEDKVRQILGLR
jgi:pyruvate/2-oxoglutarate dehydrogenase complex dihydrolipoamide acyltransferase (E2) component